VRNVKYHYVRNSWPISHGALKHKARCKTRCAVKHYVRVERQSSHLKIVRMRWLCLSKALSIVVEWWCKEDIVNLNTGIESRFALTMWSFVTRRHARCFTNVLDQKRHLSSGKLPESHQGLHDWISLSLCVCLPIRSRSAQKRAGSIATGTSRVLPTSTKNLKAATRFIVRISWSVSQLRII
jgi:hypothetical protein